MNTSFLFHPFILFISNKDVSRAYGISRFFRCSSFGSSKISKKFFLIVAYLFNIRESIYCSRSRSLYFIVFL